MCAILVRNPLGRAMLSTALLIGTTKSLAGLIGVENGLFIRYFPSNEILVFALYGAAVGTLYHALSAAGKFRWAWLAALGVALAGLSIQHQYGVFWCCLGFAAALSAQTKMLSLNDRGLLGQILAATCIVAMTVELHEQYRARIHVPVTEFDRQIARYLEEQGQPNALLVGDNYEAFLQARTGHAVMSQAMTSSYVTYMASLGPSLQNIYHDIYGIDYGITLDDPHERQPETWKTLWRNRSKKEWQSLGKRYQFNYVIAPTSLEMSIDPVLHSKEKNLYHIPSDP
jgi:hypothetical protein